ncbi:DUF2852 domain-containing protein [Pelagovum pacificum]|uniref:DUF2852 domain-containing protein n=1 Tax=Pelagovum pacificum TaxID=2588711 RepID=A0A5C5GEJ4_9RHOB|nr:DUF2852 domain-containing protein [Pelagovum pacificum]QQA44415.1 DUF2852 domain-containing protein [Pelagovum pacificum]TNY32467.1 DUF2852 domain-containing protein [Pelagovum pacificum]
MSISEYARPREDQSGDFALKALRIVFFTGFSIVATVLGFVFIPPAGVVIAALVAWKGFDEIFLTEERFGLRALSFIAFSGFATVATILGFVFLPPSGVALAIYFIWRGFTRFGASGDTAADVRDEGPKVPAPTGNSAFDAYRDDTLRRLEQERANFEAFLVRLRAAKDASEFDDFLDARAARVAAEGSDHHLER